MKRWRNREIIVEGGTYSTRWSRKRGSEESEDSESE